MMSEWWTYRLSDLLLFAPATYYRLFELAHADLWPAQPLALALGAACWLLAWRGTAMHLRTMLVLLALAWATVAGGFLWRHYASIHWGASWMAAAFGVQAVLLAAHAVAWPRHARPAATARNLGLTLAAAGLAWPLLAPLLGRPWTQAEPFALMPDPTAVATLGLLLALPRRAPALWPLPLAWCAVTGATLWTMGSPEAWAAPGAAVLAVAALAIRRWRVT